jgi:hypothetical protein
MPPREGFSLGEDPKLGYVRYYPKDPSNFNYHPKDGYDLIVYCGDDWKRGFHTGCRAEKSC